MGLNIAYLRAMSLHLHYKKYKLAYLTGNYRLFLKGLSNRVLSMSERYLHALRWLIYQGRLQEAEETLARMPIPTTLYLQAEHYFLMGNLLTKRGFWQSSQEVFGKAENLYLSCDADPSEIIRARYNRFVCFSRMGRWNEAYEVLSSLDSLADSVEEKALIWRALAMQYARMGEKNKALAVVDRIEQLKIKDPVEFMNTMCVVVEVLTRFEEYKRSRKLISKLLLKKNKSLIARIRFVAMLIDFVSSEEKIPAPSRKFSLSREYYLKWSTLYFLQAGLKERAHEDWLQLVELFPNQYAAGFAVVESMEQKSLFSRCLDAFLAPKKELFSEKKLSPKQKKLVEVLSQQKYLHRIEIIEKVWGVSYSESYDSRFYKLVERTKGLGISIVNEGHAYRIAN